jgi:hypothetical protein
MRLRKLALRLIALTCRRRWRIRRVRPIVSTVRACPQQGRAMEKLDRKWFQLGTKASRECTSGRGKRTISDCVKACLGCAYGARGVCPLAISFHTMLNSRPRTKEGNAMTIKPRRSKGSETRRPRNERGVISP